MYVLTQCLHKVIVANGHTQGGQPHTHVPCNSGVIFTLRISPTYIQHFLCDVKFLQEQRFIRIEALVSQGVGSEDIRTNCVVKYALVL